MNITASQALFVTGTVARDVVQPALQIAVLSPSQTSLSPDNEFYAYPVIPATGQNQAVSAAGSLSVTFTSGTPAVGRMVTSSSSGASVVVQIPAAGFNTPGTVATGGVAFDPLSGGTTTVSASATGFDATYAGASLLVTVTQPEITISGDQFIGRGLQDPHNAHLGGSVHGGVTVRIASSDPAIALVAANATTPGTAFVDVFVPDGSSDASFYVQGVALGPVNITASQALFVTGTVARDVVQPALQIAVLSPSQTSLSPDNEFYAYPVIPATGQNQAVSAAGSLSVTFTSGTPAVGRLVTSSSSGASVVVQIPAAGFNTPGTVATGGVAFDPLSGGTTTVSASATGFDATYAGASLLVTVTQPEITISRGPIHRPRPPGPPQRASRRVGSRRSHRAHREQRPRDRPGGRQRDHAGDGLRGRVRPRWLERRELLRSGCRRSVR